MNNELIIALDVSSCTMVSKILTKMPDEIKWFKVGLELFTSEGPDAIRILKEHNKLIFLDLKLHDIPNTVSRAVSSAARAGVSMMTLHAAGGRAMLLTAAETARAFGEAAPKLIAVTTLTSLDRSDLIEIGITRNINEQALALSELAISAGIDGIVSSAQEVASFRSRFGVKPILVTPGIRPASEKRDDDQKRIATPSMAIKAGSNFLVVGRPVLQAADPRDAATRILNEMREAAN